MDGAADIPGEIDLDQEDGFWARMLGWRTRNCIVAGRGPLNSLVEINIIVIIYYYFAFYKVMGAMVVLMISTRWVCASTWNGGWKGSVC